MCSNQECYYNTGGSVKCYKLFGTYFDILLKIWRYAYSQSYSFYSWVFTEESEMLYENKIFPFIDMNGKPNGK